MQRDIWYVQAPPELAGELALEGFDIAGMRGALEEALAASAIAVNVVTILVAKDKVAEFIGSVRSWMTHRTAAPEGSELVLDLSARNGDQRLEVRVVARRTVSGAPPLIDTAVLEALLASTLEDVPGVASEHHE
ncbi:hypothetical protein ABH920_010054 [Catenulispora sp. EB89]|uniref:hypothetical protein n=1 Tax=Catenulispora sp. EB89 TaxID=3156257 RepID=UPI00351661F7